MLKKLFSAALIVFINMAAYSQLNTAVVKNSYEIKKEIPSKAFLQFARSLKPGSVSGSYDKQMKLISGNVTPQMDGEMLSKKIVQLAGAVKPAMFKQGYKFNAGPFEKNMQASMNLLKSFESGLKPEAMQDGWKFQKNAWLEEIGKIK